MRKPLISFAGAFALAVPLAAQEEPQGAPSPGEIVAQAAAEEWITIPSEELIIMTLAPGADGTQRKVVIQLMPAPFSQNWVENIRTLARAGWYDNISVNRVQDNYVVQWGDPNYDNPEAEGETKSLPPLQPTDEGDYTVPADEIGLSTLLSDSERDVALTPDGVLASTDPTVGVILANGLFDLYAQVSVFQEGWPLASDFGVTDENQASRAWPIHCYGMVGSGRGYSPDAGTGAELYTVIGHAPRHLDRNIALVGRIVEGMEHLSSLPRGSGSLGFYAEDETDKRTPILTVRVASDLPEAERPKFEYLSTEGEAFSRYADARANRRDPFFIVPAGGADICNIPVPVRRIED